MQRRWRTQNRNFAFAHRKNANGTGGSNLLRSTNEAQRTASVAVATNLFQCDEKLAFQSDETRQFESPSLQQRVSANSLPSAPANQFTANPRLRWYAFLQRDGSFLPQCNLA